MRNAIYIDNEGRKGTQVYSEGISTADIISPEPLLSDPYEYRYCYVDISTIPNGGDGLFAKENLPADVRTVNVLSNRKTF